MTHRLAPAVLFAAFLLPLLAALLPPLAAAAEPPPGSPGGTPESMLLLHGPAESPAPLGEAAGLGDAAYQGPQGIRPPPRPDGRPLRLYRNAMVESLIRYFLEQRRELVERGWRRSGRYMAMIRRILKEEGVPQELAYLAAVESNFNPHARSPARAVGMWQFTAPTARSFGLRIEPPWYDERIDPQSSTHAAARLLAYLYDRYENWELALAAYNAGEARVNAALARAQRSGAATDYWSLRLPRQTQGFVPAFLAIAAIMEAPETHGLVGLERDKPLPSEGLQLSVAVTLGDLAERLGLAPEHLLRRNPAWKGGLIPPLEIGTVLLWVPPGSGERLLASLAERPPQAVPLYMHTVREGETVSGIAVRYRLRTRDVLDVNHLHASSLLAIGQRLLVPIAREVALATTEPVPTLAPNAGTAPAESLRHLHRVQDGESLWSISRQYGVRMAQLRNWNRLPGQTVHPDQELVVYLPGGWTAVR